MTSKSDPTGLTEEMRRRLELLSPAQRALFERKLGLAGGEVGREQTPIPRISDGTPVPLTVGQEVLWTLQRALPDVFAYNVPRVLSVVGPLDLAALESALNAIVDRHEMLRTRFVDSPDGPRQVVDPSRSVPFELLDLRTNPPSDAELDQLVAERARRPFELTTDAQLRASVIRTGEDAWTVVLVSHHIASDEASRDVLFRELGVLYDAARSGDIAAGVASLPNVGIRYADFAVWQRNEIERGALGEQIEYWRQRLAGLGVLELPTDRPPTSSPSFKGARHRSTIPDPIRAGVHVLAREHNASPFMVLLAVVNVVLHRYTEQRDVAVGSPVSGRNRPELESIIGYFPSQVILRSDVDPALSFGDLLDQVRETVLGAFEHQDVPVERLLAEVSGRDDPQAPLFRVSVQMAGGGSTTPPHLGDARVTVVGTNVGSAKFDLLVGFEDAPDGLHMLTEYRTELFDEGSIERFVGHVRTVLESTVADAGVAVGAIPMITPAETHQLLEEWAGERVAYTQGSTLVELLLAQVRRTPHAIAVNDDRRSMTYAELDAAATALALRLRRAGVGRGARVGVCAERSVELVIALIASVKAGAAYVPLDPEYPHERIAFMLEDADIAALLTTEALAEVLPPCTAPVFHLDGVAEATAEPGPPEVLPAPSADDPAYLIYTSGSTGQPKGAVNSHRGIVNRLLWMQSTNPLQSTDVYLQKTPFSFDVSVPEFFWPLLAGARLVMAQPGGHRDTGYLIDVIKREGITICHFVPSMLRAFLSDPGAGECTTLRQVLASGEALPPDLTAVFARVLPRSVLLNLYGPTECAVEVSYWYVPRSEVPPAVVPIGRPVANTRLYVLDTRGALLPIGVAGELYLAGVQVGMGYHNRPELTAERFVADPFARADERNARMYRTGDRARWRADGTVEYLGRLDFQVKVRGFRVELGEIETTLLRQDGIRDAVVVVREETGDATLVAYFVPDGEAPSAIALRDAMRETLPDYMVPSAFVPLESIPLMSNGKANRRALLDMPAPHYEAVSEQTSTYRAPRTALERQLAEQWSALLHRANVGVEDDFFALGGHSLLAMRMLGKLIELTGVRLPLRVVFERRTIAGIAEAIAGAKAAAPVSPIPTLPPDAEVPLSHGQELLWLMQLATPTLSAYNIPQLWRIRGDVDVDALDRALLALIDRHDALRTIVQPRGDRAVQRLVEVTSPVLVQEDVSGMSQDKRADVARGRVESIAGTPFDLSRERAFRAVLIRVARDEHWLLLVLHHAVADGWSVGVITRDLSLLYEQAASDADPLLLVGWPIPYRDYAGWQRKTLTEETLESELAWWRAQLGAPASLELPTDRPRTSALSFEGARRVSMFSPALLARLHKIAAAQGTTLYSVLLAGYAVLLHRCSGQREVIVGTVVANRNRPDLDGTVGYFANTIPLRVSLTDDPEFVTLVRRVHDVFLEASEHTDIPFEQLALEFHDGSRASDPLVQAMFILQNNDESALTLTGLDVERMDIGAAGAKVELTLSMTERADGLRAALQYRRALFDESTIDRMLAQLGTLLESASLSPAQRVSEVQLLTPQEREMLATRWNDTARDIPHAALHVLVRAAAERALSATAVSAEDGALTYVQLLDRSASIATALAALGVAPGGRVAVCMSRRTDLVATLLAVLRMGAAYVPLDPAYPIDRISYVLEDAGVDAIVVDAFAPPLGEQSVRVLQIDQPMAAVADADYTDAEASPESLAYVLYTSGSTGRPKGVMIPHRALVNFLVSMRETPGLSAADAIVAVTTVSFDISGLELWLPLISGAEVVLASRKVAVDGAALRALVERTAAARPSGKTLLQATPSTWRLLIEAEWQGTHNVVMLCGGEAWPAGLASQLLERGKALWNVYGPTETTIWSTRARITSDDVPLGEPLANTTLHILERGGAVAPLGVPGELWIGGAGLALGYHGRPDLTAERFVEHPEFGRLYRTGDLVRRIPNGTLRYLGRIDDQVKVRGYRIELGEIEAVVIGMPEVVDVVASVQRAPDGEPRLVCYVVLSEPGVAREAFIVASIREGLTRALPDYMVPSAIKRLDALPLTPNGKVDRRALPQISADDAIAARPYVEPRSPLEADIAAVWKDVLGAERVGVDDDFFALGGHSLLAMRVIARLAETLPVRITIGAMFEARTVAGLATNVVQRMAAREVAAGVEDDLALLLDELDALSDDDAARLLDSEERN